VCSGTVGLPFPSSLIHNLTATFFSLFSQNVTALFELERFLCSLPPSSPLPSLLPPSSSPSHATGAASLETLQHSAPANHSTDGGGIASRPIKSLQDDALLGTSLPPSLPPSLHSIPLLPLSLCSRLWLALERRRLFPPNRDAVPRGHRSHPTRLHSRHPPQGTPSLPPSLPPSFSCPSS